MLFQNAQCCENAIMRFHGVYNIKTLRKKLRTHSPGSAPGPLTIDPKRTIDLQLSTVTINQKTLCLT